METLFKRINAKVILQGLLYVLVTALLLNVAISYKMNGYFAASFIIVVISIIYYALHLKNNISILFFLIAFFTFLQARQFMIFLKMYGDMLKFAPSIANDTYYAVLLSIVGVLVGYLIYFKKNPEENSINNRKLFNKLDLELVREVSKKYFYFAVMLAVIVNIDKILFVRQFGYAAYYTHYVSKVPYVLVKIAETSVISLVVYLATKPNIKKIRIPLLLFFLEIGLTLLTGKRFDFVSGIMLIAVFFVLTYIEQVSSFYRKHQKLFLLSIILVLLIIIFSAYYIGQTRWHNRDLEYNPIRIFTRFFYEQGVTINTIKSTFKYDAVLGENRFFLFGNIIRMFNNNFIARELGWVYYTGNTVENALYGNSLAHSLSYLVLKEQYLQGYGVGSSYIAELYNAFGFVGVFSGSILIGNVLGKYRNYNERHLFLKVALLLIFRPLIFSPRGNFDGFIAEALQPINIIGVLIIILISFIANSKYIKSLGDHFLYKYFFKRLFDIVLSLILLPFIGIICIIFGILIFIEDGSPIFYVSTRRGKDGVTFKMIKLRSMKNDSPDLRMKDGSTYNAANDSRQTKIGKIIRKLSIDELPQVFNVLIGDMSFIGPRPSLVSHRYNELSEEKKKRLQVRPGITGYSQAYYRNRISQEEKIRYDCWYVDHVSFLTDLKIIFKTIKTVLGEKNIYNG